MRREFSAKVKTAAARRAGDKCEECGRDLRTGDYYYEFDHEIPDAIGGENTADNCRVLCRSCHARKTAEVDAPRIAKARRNYKKSRGIRKPSRFPGARNSPFKKKLNGQVVKRQPTENT